MFAKKKRVSRCGIFIPRAALALALYLGGIGLAILSFAGNVPNGSTGANANPQNISSSAEAASPGQLHRGLYRGMPVTYVVKHGQAIFQGDIILEKVDLIEPLRPPPSAGIDSFGLDYAQYLWPKVGDQYQIPYVIASGSGNLTNLNNAIAQFNSTFLNIKLVARTTQTDYVNFYFDPNDNSAQCDATVGRTGGEEQVGGSGGSFNPCTVGTLLHELGHVVGLWHEQSRPDRDNYISVNYSNLIKGSISNFNQIHDNAQQTTLFDYASIMHYPPFSFSRNGGPAIESIPAGIPLSNFTGYAAADIDGIERLYGNSPASVTVTSNPPGLQVIVDGTTVTTPQVFNWTLNSNHALDIPPGVQSQAGYIRNSTEPTTFYYIYGRWNDSTAAAHSITITPGNGDPAAPTTSPAVTTYSANFIQLVPYAAAVYPPGTGAVTPSPAPQSYPGSPLVFYTARQQVTLTATPNAGQNFYEFNNAPFWLPGGLGANPKTFYVPDTGLTVNTTAEFSPDPVYTVNVSPNPFSSNLYIYGDAGFSYAPKNFSAFYDSTWTPGSSHTLSVDTPEYPYSSNSRFVFDNWSDGAMTPSHTVILPSTSSTYTANLTPQFYVTDYVNQPCAGSITITPGSPTGDGFYPSGAGVTFTETPNSGWLFTGWQYDLSGTSSSQPLTVTDEVLVAVDYNTIGTPLMLTSLDPSRALAGGGDFTLTLNGTGFTPSSLVSVNGTFPAVNFIDSTQLSVPITAAQIARPGAFQVWVENYPNGAACAAFAALPFTVAYRLTPVQLNSVVSEFTHGSAGTFDINLPMTGNPGVESRSSSALGSGSYKMIFTFSQPLANVGAAGVTNGNGSVSSSTINPNNAAQYVVNLMGVSNARYVTVTLTNVSDSVGNFSGTLSATMGVLIGDTSANGVVNAADVALTKAQLGSSVGSGNFRADVNANGTINAADTASVKAKAGTSLP